MKHARWILILYSVMSAWMLGSTEAQQLKQTLVVNPPSGPVTPFTGKQCVQPVCCFRFSPDGKILASDQRENIALWNIQSGKRLATWKGHSGDVISMRFSPDGKWLASASADKTVRL
ncbi:MAG: WD40 repeat domain-containing protein [Gemmataceae bacterium]